MGSVGDEKASPRKEAQGGDKRSRKNEKENKDEELIGLLSFLFHYLVAAVI
jgi:hypothetical protein